MNMEIIPHPAGPALPALIAGQGTCAGPKETYSPCDRKCRFIACPPDQIETIKPGRSSKLELFQKHLVVLSFREGEFSGRILSPDRDCRASSDFRLGGGVLPGWGGGYLPYPDYSDYSDYEPAMTEALPWESAAQPYQAAPPETVEAAHLRAVMPSRNEAAEPPRELPPTVLVFRDGHEEEVKSYTIIDKTLYTSANYWTTGSWTREIEIANLDVPATLKLNQERGSKFSLPSGPQEVVIRP